MDGSMNLALGGKPEKVQTTVDSLPSEVLVQCIFPHLHGRDRYRLQYVSRYWKLLSETALDWESQYRSIWELPSDRRLHACLSALDVSTTTPLSFLQRQSIWKHLWNDKYRSMASVCSRRCSTITNYGHKLGVKVVRFAGTDTLLTGGVDRRLIAWRACEHFGFRGISSPFAGTVRTVDCDGEVLVAGSSDHRIRLWRKENDAEGISTVTSTCAEWLRGDWDRFSLDSYVTSRYSASEQATFDAHCVAQNRRLDPFPPHSVSTAAFPFNVSSNTNRIVLSGHSGPVSSVAILPHTNHLVSGSWDYTVRLWSTKPDNPTTLQVLPFSDWVVDAKYSHATGQVLVASGSNVHVLDRGTGSLIKMASHKHKDATIDYPITCICPSVDGSTVFYAADGHIFSVDLRSGASSSIVVPFSCAKIAPNSKKIHSRSLVTGMALEFPFIAFSLSSGQVGVLNVEDGFSKALCGPGGIASSVDISEGRVVAGFDDGSTMVWEFRPGHVPSSIKHRRRLTGVQP